MPPCPDETAWISKLGERFGVAISPYPSVLFEELAGVCYGGRSFGDARRAGRAAAADADAARRRAGARRRRGAADGGFRLLRYTPLFSGPAVERVPELQFQRPGREVELARDDARRLGIATGDAVRVSHNGTSVELRARLTRDAAAGRRPRRRRARRRARAARRGEPGVGSTPERQAP